MEQNAPSNIVLEIKFYWDTNSFLFTYYFQLILSLYHQILSYSIETYGPRILNYLLSAYL